MARESNSRLDAIRKKLKSTNLGGGSDFWKPKPGDNSIRLLPGVGEMDDIFWIEIGTHFLKIGARWKSWICPTFTADLPCPICEYVNALYSTGDDDDQKMAKDIRVSKAYAVNIIDRKNEDKGPQIYSAGVTVMRQWAALIGDQEYGDLIIDPDDGLDLTITRTGQQRQTVYTVTARRKTSPLSDDPDKIDEWLDKAIDLTPVELTDNSEEDTSAYRDENGVQVAAFGIASYERIKNEFEGVEDVPEEEADKVEEETEEDEGYQDVRKAISRRRNRGSSARTKPRTPRRRA